MAAATVGHHTEADARLLLMVAVTTVVGLHHMVVAERRHTEEAGMLRVAVAADIPVADTAGAVMPHPVEGVEVTPAAVGMEAGTKVENLD